MSHTKNILLLGSKSPSRKKLLEEAKIPFICIEQDVDETKCDWALPLEQVVKNIALYKMQHLIMPHGQQGDISFVLTADTLSQDHEGSINGKPVDRDDAVRMIKSARNGSRLVTAFCLDKKICIDGAWQIEKRVVRNEQSVYEFIIPDRWIDIYLNNSIGLAASNAIAIEEFGAQFLKVMQGSFSTIVGLPMFQLREALEELEFFSF